MAEYTLEELKAWLDEIENQINSPNLQKFADKFKPQIDELREKINQISESVRSSKTNNKLSFDEYFALYLDYVGTQKTGDIDYCYCTSDGIQLGMWVKGVLNPKITCGTLKDNYVSQLLQYPYKYMVKPLFWDEWFNLAVSLANEQNKYIFRIIYNDTYKVGRWLKRQIFNISHLSIERREKIITAFNLLLPNKYRYKSESERKQFNGTPEERWNKHISTLKSSDEKLDQSNVMWIQRRITDCLSVSQIMTLSRQQTQELYELICDLLQSDRIDFIDNGSISANDYVKYCKMLVYKMEKDIVRKESLFKILDLKYVSKFVSLADITGEHFEQRSDRSIAELSFLSIAQIYVNTCENNTLSARQNADLLRFRTYSYNDPYDFG